MSINIGSSINLGGHEIQNARVQNLSIAPSNPSSGLFYYDTTINSFFGHNGTSWIDLGRQGTVFSVGLSLPSIFNVSGSPVTGSGTLSATLASQTQRTFLAAPAGADGTPSFRGIGLTDISSALGAWSGSVNLTTLGVITSGTWNGSVITPAYGGTGLSSGSVANGQLLIGNGSGYTLGTLTAGTGIGVANGSGSITISNNGVLSVNAGGLGAGTGAISISAGTGISISGTPSSWSISSTAATSVTFSGSFASNLSGSVSSNVLTLTPSGTPSFTNITLNGFTLTSNGSNPSAVTDVVTYGYVLNQSFGLRDFKESVQNILTSLAGVTYTATTVGTFGTGRITGAPNTLNSVSLVAGARILVAVSGGNAANGIYTVSTVGTGANGVWDRAQDFSSASNVSLGAYVFVEATASGYILSGPTGTLTIGGASGSALSFIQYLGAGTYLAGTNLSLSGNTFSLSTSLTGLTSVTTSALTIGTISGVLKATSGVVSAAVAGTDFLAPSAISGTLNSIVKYTSTSAIGSSLLSDNGTVLSYSGTGGFSAASLTATGLSVGAVVRTTTGGLLTTGAVSLASEVTGVLGVTNGGSGQSAWALGQILYGSGANATALLNGNTTTTKQFLSQTGNGTVSAAPAWSGITISDISNLGTWTGSSSITTVGNISSGTWNGNIVGVSRGGTGVNASTAADGQLLIGNGSGFTLATLTAGANITISNTPGGIQISSTGSGTGTVNKYTTTITGDGSTTSFVVNHGLNTSFIVPFIAESSTPFGQMFVETRVTTVNSITLVFGIAPIAGKSYNVTVVG